MKGKADGSSLDLLETKFSRERDNAFIRSLTDSVKGFEYRSRKQAESVGTGKAVKRTSRAAKGGSRQIGQTINPKRSRSRTAPAF